MENTAAADATSAMLISFAIGGQGYCVDVMVVREIRGWTPATQLPSTPSHVRGMINLRGAVIPVIDLGIRLGLGPCEQTARSVVIVVELGDRLVGLLVDAVWEILTVRAGDVQPTPDVGAQEVRQLVKGVVTSYGTQLLTWLGLEQIMTDVDKLAA